MKKTILRMGSVLLISLLLVFALFGCSDKEPREEEPPAAVSVVIGNHGNMYAANLSNPDLVSTVARAAANGFVSVICADGTPYTVSADIYVVPEQYRQADPKKLEADAQQKAAKLLSSLIYVKAQSPELDTLKALEQAVRSLSAAPGGSIREIYVIDTGLSTGGILDFRKNLLSAEPAVIADLLAERNAIPDFTNITVKWAQMGDVSLPQPSLSRAQVQRLGEIWGAIIEKGGGTMKLSETPPGQSVNDSGSFPLISVVNLPPEKPLAFETEAVAFEKNEPVVFTEKQIQFLGDTAKYAAPKRVNEELKPVAAYMMANPNFTGLLVGTTASGRKDFCLRLSRSRADAVQNTLVSLGVSANQLVTCGLGFDDPWHIPDTDRRGRLVENLASQNRKVLLMAADSESAKDILE